MGVVATDSVTQTRTRSGKLPVQKPGRSKQDYKTPRPFVHATCARLRISEFAHDLAASATNTVCASWWGPGGFVEDAFSVNWRCYLDKRRWHWLNPPFADIAPWAERCRDACEYGIKIAFLVPAAVGSNWFAQHVHRTAQVWLLNGRLHFDEEHPTWGYPKDLILALYGLPPAYRVWRHNAGKQS